MLNLSFCLPRKNILRCPLENEPVGNTGGIYFWENAGMRCMQTVIYADTLVVLNFILTYLLLLCSASVLKVLPSPLRFFIGSLLGGLSSLVIFLPNLGVIPTFIIKALICAAITFASFPCRSIVCFLKSAAVFLLCNILLAGMIFALEYIFAPGGISLKNGAVYFDLDFFSHVLTAAVSFVLVSAYNRYTRRQMQNEKVYRLKVYLGKNSFECDALYDSGNSLTDGCFGSPVTVVSFETVKDFIPYELTPFFSGEICDIYECSDLWYGRIRFIPAETVSGESLLPCFRSDRAEITTDNAVYVTYRALIAVTSKGLKNKDYSAVVGPDMFSDNTKGGQNETERIKGKNQKEACIPSDKGKGL